jgi:hypothetical protein
MIRSKAFIGAFVLCTAFAVSACATETSYTVPANDYSYNAYLGYPYECNYGLGYECPPYVYGPPVVFDRDHFDHFDRFHHFDHFHGHPMHVGHGLGAFGGHGFAGHGGHGFAGHGGGHR